MNTNIAVQADWSQARRYRLFAGLLCVCMVLPAGSVLADYTFANISDNSGKFSNFEPGAAINRDGTVAFLGYFDFNLGGGSGIFTSDGRTETPLATTGDRFLALGGGVALNDHGVVAFRGYTDSFFDMGIFTATPGGEVSTIALNDDVLNDMGALPAINNSGKVAFFANLAEGGSGIYTGDSTGYDGIFEKDSQWGIGTVVDINAKGEVTGWLSDPSGESAIYTGHTGVLDPFFIACTGGESPFKSLNGAPSINDRGTVAFAATLNDGEDGEGQSVRIHPPDAGESDVASTTDESTFTTFNYPVANNNDQVAFLAGYGSRDAGIFTGQDQEADAVVKTGSELFGSTIDEVRFGAGGFNDNGEVAFFYRLATGIVGIAVASPGELTRKLGGGQDYDGVRVRSDEGSGMIARLRGGQAGADRSVELDFIAKTDVPVGSFSSLLGDVFSMSGTQGDLFVLELSYTDEDLAAAGAPDETKLFINWLDPADKTAKNAVLGNTPSGGTPHSGMTYDAYLQSQSGVPKLGDHGNSPETNTLWAVLNHTSLFGATVPETTTPPETGPFKSLVSFASPNPLGGGNFVGFSTGLLAPALNNGVVAFIGGNVSHSGSYFTVPVTGGPVTSIVANRDIMPDEPTLSTPTFISFERFSFDGSALAFIGFGWEFNSPGANAVGGVYLAENGKVITIANTYSAIPGDPGSFRPFYFGIPAVDGGQVAFHARSVAGHSGIYAHTSAGLVLVADQSVKKPGSDETFLGNFCPDLAFEDGELVFSAQTKLVGSIDAIFKTSGGVESGILETVVDTSVTVPGTDEKFSAVTIPDISNGEVVFWGQGNDFNTSGLYTTVGGGGIHLVANRHTKVPEGVGNFVQLDRDNALAIVDDRIMFMGYSETIDNAPGGVSGIYLWDAGEIRKIVDTTDKINDRRIARLSMGRESFDGTGLVFTAYLEPRFFGDTFQGVYYVPISQSGQLTLTIKPVAPDSVRLSWPDSIEGAHLDASTTLLPGSWSGVSGVVLHENGENAVIEKIDTAGRYYRLARP